MRASLAVHSRENSGRTLDGVTGTLGFLLERRFSLVLITMLVAATGVSLTFLQRLIGRWAFALAFRSIRLPRRRLLCSHVAGSTQAVLSGWSSAGRASPYHRTRSFAGNEPEGRTL